MPSCFALNCTTRNASHRLPSDKLRRKQWLNNIRREVGELDLEEVRLCLLFHITGVHSWEGNQFHHSCNHTNDYNYNKNGCLQLPLRLLH